VRGRPFECSNWSERGAAALAVSRKLIVCVRGAVDSLAAYGSERGAVGTAKQHTVRRTGTESVPTGSAVGRDGGVKWAGWQGKQRRSGSSTGW